MNQPTRAVPPPIISEKDREEKARNIRDYWEGIHRRTVEGHLKNISFRLALICWVVFWIPLIIFVVSFVVMIGANR